jgi:uncharacterized protein YsxB (DUF464 family)
MTIIRLLAAPDGNLTGFEVSGHAGAGTEGNDLVCAAVSFLATTCANALESVANKKTFVRQREGCLRVTLKDSNLSPEASVILKTFSQGAKDLQQAYPAHVRLTRQAQ